MDKAEGERKASIEDSGHQLSFSSAVLMYITVSHRLPPGEEHGLQFNRFIKLHPSLHRSNTYHPQPYMSSCTGTTSNLLAVSESGGRSISQCSRLSNLLS